jgi:hypothetical protein
LYNILIETAFNPQSRRGEEIENYLETLLVSYDKELEALRRRTQVSDDFLRRELNMRLSRVSHRNFIDVHRNGFNDTLLPGKIGFSLFSPRACA